MTGKRQPPIKQDRQGRSPPVFLLEDAFRLFVKGGVKRVKVLGIQPVSENAEAFANTINMKWITKEPPTLFFDGILTNSQLFCAFIKVPLQPYSLYWGYAAIFLRIHSLSSAIHQLSSKIWYSIIVAWR